jgi:hypothetical protein
MVKPWTTVTGSSMVVKSMTDRPPTWWIEKRMPWLAEGARRIDRHNYQKEKQMKETQKISYKYDLMHRNTPRFARTTIQWDTALMTPITRKRVINALTNPDVKIGHGDAGQMYQALRDKFELPHCKAFVEKYRDGDICTHIYLEHANEAIREEANNLLQAHMVMERLDGGRYWGDTEVNTNTRHLRFYRHPCDLTRLIELMHEFMDSPEPKKRARDAIMFIEDGGVLTFTYNPTDR